MLGFIGCGNMAQAMLKGILDKKCYQPEEIIVSRRNEEALAQIEKAFSVCVTTDNKEVAKKADVLVLAVKPFQFEAGRSGKLSEKRHLLFRSRQDRRWRI